MHKIINEENVHVYFNCPECNQEYDVNPKWMAESGVPVCCDCDVECEYSHIEVPLVDRD